LDGTTPLYFRVALATLLCALARGFRTLDFALYVRRDVAAAFFRIAALSCSSCPCNRINSSRALSASHTPHSSKPADQTIKSVVRSSAHKWSNVVPCSGGSNRIPARPANTLVRATYTPANVIGGRKPRVDRDNMTLCLLLPWSLLIVTTKAITTGCTLATTCVTRKRIAGSLLKSILDVKLLSELDYMGVYQIIT
jgi:hypothetical protein